MQVSFCPFNQSIKLRRKRGDLFWIFKTTQDNNKRSPSREEEKSLKAFCFFFYFFFFHKQERRTSVYMYVCVCVWYHLPKYWSKNVKATKNKRVELSNQSAHTASLFFSTLIDNFFKVFEPKSPDPFYYIIVRNVRKLYWSVHFTLVKPFNWCKMSRSELFFTLQNVPSCPICTGKLGSCLGV